MCVCVRVCVHVHVFRGSMCRKDGNKKGGRMKFWREAVLEQNWVGELVAPDLKTLRMAVRVGGHLQPSSLRA